MNKSIRLPLALLLLVPACTVGPDYVKPSVETPQNFKEAGQWRVCSPQAPQNQNWWEIYNDSTLNALEKQIDISNQTLKQFEAQYRAAVAIADQTRAGLFPTVGLNASGARNGLGQHTAVNSYDLSAGAAWSLDLWGKIRRTLESNEANAEADAADIAGARLSAQAELATDYYALRTQDALQDLLEQTSKDDDKIVTIIKNQYAQGVAAQSDLLAAQTLAESAHANAVGTAVQRAQLEHAIAVLIGKPPAEFSLVKLGMTRAVPMIPAQIPSALLERRPDIAAAERQMAAANALIGVAVAAYYPDVSLSASYGFGAGTVGSLFSAASTIWAFGAAASEQIIDWGARDAATEQAKANFDASVAFYRQTVLTAFQNVEDNLAAQRILVDQEKAQNQATSDAKKSEAISLNQYKAGLIPYNQVLTAQVTQLANEQQSLTILSNRLAASVALIEALGGGWTVENLKNATENQ